MYDHFRSAECIKGMFALQDGRIDHRSEDDIFLCSSKCTEKRTVSYRPTTSCLIHAELSALP